jgi:hypothetical protein
MQKDSPLQYAEQIAYSSKQVLRFSFDQASKYKDIPNTCMVEAGVAAGAQIIALMAGSECKVPIYALDSWNGIPLPSNKDNQYPGIRFISESEQKALPNPGEQLLESSGATVVSQDDFLNHVHNAIGDNLNLVMCKGWFEEMLPVFECPPISILRLDADLYNSTYVCLKYLYPKVIKGGLVIIDDWALPGCRQAVEDYFMDNGIGDFKYQWLKMEFIKDANSTVAYWTK